MMHLSTSESHEEVIGFSTICVVSFTYAVTLLGSVAFLFVSFVLNALLDFSGLFREDSCVYSFFF